MQLIPAILGSVLLASTGSNAVAATIDLADGIYTELVAGSMAGSPTSFSETVNGATFVFTATENLGGGTPQFQGFSGALLGLRLGGIGTTVEFTLQSSAGVQLESYSTVSSGSTFTSYPGFDVTGGMAASSGNLLEPDIPVNPFAGGPVSIAPGTLYTFTLTNTGTLTYGHISSIEFSSVPLPAPVILLGSALAGMFVRRRALPR